MELRQGWGSLWIMLLFAASAAPEVLLSVDRMPHPPRVIVGEQVAHERRLQERIDATAEWNLAHR
jgi:hypothetical protein